MHPGSAISVAYKVSVVIFDDEVEDVVAFCAAVPANLLDNQTWPCARDDGVADCQPARRHKALALDKERMLPAARDHFRCLPARFVGKRDADRDSGVFERGAQHFLVADLARLLVLGNDMLARVDLLRLPYYGASNSTLNLASSILQL